MLFELAGKHLHNEWAFFADAKVLFFFFVGLSSALPRQLKKPQRLDMRVASCHMVTPMYARKY